jgi:hypothetical protein
MVDKRSRKHHFVPEVLQKQFCFEGKRLWYCERKDRNSFSKPEIRNVESCFRKKDHYTVYVEGKPSDIVERKYYGKIDNYLGAVIAGVIKCFNEEKIPVFSGEPLESIRQTIYNLIKRTPHFFEKYDELEVGRDLLKRQIKALKELKDTRVEARVGELTERLRDSSYLIQRGRDVRVRSALRSYEKVEMLLGEFSVRWAVSDTRHSFILSSLIAYRIGNGGSNGLSNPNVELWMPIAPKVALVLCRDFENKVPLKSTVSPNHMRQINEYVVANSNQIAASSERLLLSLTGK